MSEIIVGIFDVFERAEQARLALLAAGFERAEVQVRVASDEAGPVEGNFTVGNSPVESVHHTYARNYATIRQAGHCIVSINSADPLRAARASAILARFGAREGDPAARRGPLA